MTQPSLLHETPTALEVVHEQATDPYRVLDATISSLHGLKLLNPPASFLPYLVWEYGLGELQPYVPNLYDLISEGVAWQRVRGTPLAMEQGLGWLGYEAIIEEEPIRRLFWNNFQLELDRVRDDEVDLPRIEGIATLSSPFRSDLWRGFCGYDVREAEASYSLASEVLASDDSGVRLPGGSAKWSFGRSYEHAHEITSEDLAALGLADPWALTIGDEPLTLDGEPLRFVPGGGDAGWTDTPWLDVPWLSDEVWAASVALLIAAGEGPAWAVFKNAAGNVLFYRRCRVRRSVVPTNDGVYAHGNSRFSPGIGVELMLEALTDFGEGYGQVAASVGFILSAAPGSGHKIGVDHLPPGGLAVAGPIIGDFAVHIEFGRTVRERVACLLRF